MGKARPNACYSPENAVEYLYLYPSQQHHREETAMEQNKTKPLGFWMVLIAVLAAVAIVGMILVHGNRHTGGAVQVTQNGETVGLYPLDEDQTLRFDSDNGGYNIVVISGGTVRVSQASCPDQVCVRKGATDQTNDPIACLPNKLVVQVVGGGQKNNQLDGVS